MGERSGLMFTIMAFGAMCGPPISGAIRKTSEGWELVGIYAGRSKEAIIQGMSAHITLACRFGSCGFCCPHGRDEMAGPREAPQREDVMQN